MIPTAVMGIGDFFNTLMWPFRAAVSGALVIFHKLLSPIFGPASGITWVISIMLLTAVVRLALLPLFVKQMHSSRAMQSLQPKMKELQKKYGHDRERLGQETMALYRQEGVNPASSCLPLLLQMPIFIGLFQVLNAAARGNFGSQQIGYFFQTNQDVAKSLEDSTIFKARLAGTFMPIETFGATQIVCIVLIVLMCVFLFAQQLMMLNRNTPPASLEGPMGKQQKMLMYVFPLIYAFTGINIPIGVLVYWFTTNLWTFGQQYFLMRNIPTPGTPAYVAWEERMRAKGKDPREIERERVAKRQAKAKSTIGGVNLLNTDSDNETQEPKIVVRQQPVKKSRSQRKSSGGFKPKKK